jgi:hypothetical protein
MNKSEKAKDAARRLGAPKWRLFQMESPRGDDAYGRVEVSDVEAPALVPAGAPFHRSADLVVAVDMVTGETRVVKNRWGKSGVVGT